MTKATHLIPRAAKDRIKLSLHRGRKYTCPFCHYRAKDLKTSGHDFAVLTERAVIGAGVRPSKCWKCGSTDRERLVFLYLERDLGFFENPMDKSVLHIAPEKRLSRYLLSVQFRDYKCGDLFAEGYHPPAHVQNMNVLDLPFGDERFDLVICNHVLEHVTSDAIAMKELHRVVKPGGIAILQVPISANSAHTFEDDSVIDPHQREVVFGQFDHVRIYGQDYADRLQAAGFEVTRLATALKYIDYGVNPEEELFVCSKTSTTD